MVLGLLKLLQQLSLKLLQFLSLCLVCAYLVCEVGTLLLNIMTSLFIFDLEKLFTLLKTLSFVVLDLAFAIDRCLLESLLHLIDLLD